MTRRVVETNGISLDRERLQVIVIYEEGISKQDIRKENPFSKKHSVLYNASGAYEFKGLAN
ncbi:hypothetical protein KHA94_16405 [Bacillus sp. FJAT-49705]|uniref:Uncharacterized protein n=1 Tax=Cytobacillus citreus TaxID=2833586 RepID=A0ABS5NVC6_9BACI|nr:hypothetical protein [Cytobacillus citreus]MBS4191773.1 hypothetical protein [Cytobacillus citreus]